MEPARVFQELEQDDAFWQRTSDLREPHVKKRPRGEVRKAGCEVALQAVDFLQHARRLCDGIGRVRPPVRRGVHEPGQSSPRRCELLGRSARLRPRVDREPQRRPAGP
ncbi:MAG: hypothetical protein HYZ53_15170 [Planctomycetes bacterium]|nr:hypothetical protein [Planctomycetota bacterium]